jgi:hypothetical protein
LLAGDTCLWKPKSNNIRLGDFMRFSGIFFGSKNLCYTFSFCRRLDLRPSRVSPYCSLRYNRPPEYTRLNIGGNMWNVYNTQLQGCFA